MRQRVKGVKFELRERRERERERAAGRCHQLVKAMRVSRHTKLALPTFFKFFFYRYPGTKARDRHPDMVMCFESFKDDVFGSLRVSRERRAPD